MRIHDTYNYAPTENLSGATACFLNIQREVRHRHKFDPKVGTYIDMELRTIECRDDLSLYNQYQNLKIEFLTRYRKEYPDTPWTNQFDNQKIHNMTPTIQKLNTELLELYQEQLAHYTSMYEQKQHTYFDYVVCSCEQIIYVLENLLEPSIEVQLLSAQYESLLALIKLEMENTTWQKEQSVIHSTQRFSKKPRLQNKKKNYI